jgi:hypothetical protein
VLFLSLAFSAALSFFAFLKRGCKTYGVGRERKHRRLCMLLGGDGCGGMFDIRQRIAFDDGTVSERRETTRQNNKLSRERDHIENE